MEKVLVPYRTALFVLLVSALASCVFLIVYLLFAESQYIRIEKSEAFKSISRVENIIRYKIRSIESTTKDYAQWDDTWAYLQGENPDFCQINFTSQSLGNLDIDFMALYGKEGRLLYAFHRLGKTIPWPANAAEWGSPFFAPSPILSGLYLLENLPMILSSQVVTRNNGVGPPIGRFIFGKELDRGVLQDWEELAGLPIELQPFINGNPLPPKEPQWEISDKQIRVSKGIPDCNGEIRFLCAIVIPRQHSTAGGSSIHLIGLLFLFITVLILSVFFSSNRLFRTLRILNQSLEQEVQNRTIELQLYRDIIQNMAEGVLIMDSKDLLQETNAAFTRILGYEKKELLGRRIDDILLHTSWQQIKTAAHWEGEIRCIHKDGTDRPIWFSMETLKDIRVGFFLDLTQLKSIEERLNQLAYYDSLTGLPNRVLFQDRLKSAIARAQRRKSRIALLYMDLDHFKNVNDGYGHQVGDALLVQVANRLTNLLRKEDTVSRLGGDEFTIILESIERTKDASAVAQKILDSFKDPFKIDSLELFIGTSVGIALYPFDGQTMEELIQYADAAMYEAKTLGRGQYRLVSGKSGVSSKKRIEVETLLRSALKEGHFELAYQPQLDAKSLDNKKSFKVVGVECLLRINQGNRLSPLSEFLEVTEESGLIVPIGQWVLERACKDAAQWIGEGLPVRVCVNISPRQFEKGQIVEQTIQALEQSHLDPRFLILELTESLFIRNTAQAADIVKQLKTLGIGFAIDDFGTGYSSLLYVKALPIDSLKIDKSFIDDLSSGNHDKTMALAIISMARSFGLVSIAEGVETEIQCQLLRSWGCDILQGYYLYKPMSHGEFYSLLTGTNINP